MSFSCHIDGARPSKKNFICKHCFNLEIRGYITKNFEKKNWKISGSRDKSGHTMYLVQVVIGTLESEEN